MSCRYASIVLHFKTITMANTNQKNQQKLFEKPLLVSVDNFTNRGIMVMLYCIIEQIEPSD